MREAASTQLVALIVVLLVEPQSRFQGAVPSGHSHPPSEAARVAPLVRFIAASGMWPTCQIAQLVALIVVLLVEPQSRFQGGCE